MDLEDLAHDKEYFIVFLAAGDALSLLLLSSLMAQAARSFHDPCSRDTGYAQCQFPPSYWSLWVTSLGPLIGQFNQSFLSRISHQKIYTISFPALISLVQCISPVCHDKLCNTFFSKLQLCESK